MAKLNKQYYYSSKGEKKVNCYKLNISKRLLEEGKAYPCFCTPEELEAEKEALSAELEAVKAELQEIKNANFEKETNAILDDEKELDYNNIVFMEDPDEFEEDVEIGLGKEMLGL